jgi:hypothetical protein
MFVVGVLSYALSMWMPWASARTVASESFVQDAAFVVPTAQALVGDQVFVGAEGLTGSVATVQGYTREQGALMYETSAGIFAASETLGVVALTVPLLGTVLTATLGLWGMLLFVGVPLAMFATQFGWRYAFRFARAGGRVSHVFARIREARRLRHEARGAEQELLAREEVELAYTMAEDDVSEDDERVGVTELDTLARPHDVEKLVPGYKVIIGNRSVRFG